MKEDKSIKFKAGDIVYHLLGHKLVIAEVCFRNIPGIPTSTLMFDGYGCRYIEGEKLSTIYVSQEELVGDND